MVAGRLPDGVSVLRGSFATVKKGIPKDGGKAVAIKIVDKKDKEYDANALQQEIAIMKKVNHPNCIKLIEVKLF
eukprot:766311-Hanusia_phi.AAC.1